MAALENVFYLFYVDKRLFAEWNILKVVNNIWSIFAIYWASLLRLVIPIGHISWSSCRITFCTIWPVLIMLWQVYFLLLFFEFFVVDGCS